MSTGPKWKTNTCSIHHYYKIKGTSSDLEKNVSPKGQTNQCMYYIIFGPSHNSEKSRRIVCESFC